ncbi:MAG: hypothetical protein EBR30_15055 [Cytophagia bacterium]|nr:hypothetical protein [Cytophagia bacterium]NBW36303.1 hypothetical protein [Cytophagia bacterium]
MILKHDHFISGLPVSDKIAYIKLLAQLVPSLEAILIIELTTGNKIREIRANTKEADDLTILLQHQYHQAYESNQLIKLVETDAHDHGVFYMTKEKPQQILVAPYL